MFLTNRPDTVRCQLAPGIYGLSNGALDEPWPKTLKVKERLHDWIVGDIPDPAALLEGLRENRLPNAGLPSAAPSDVPQEPDVSTVFVRDPVYGTRCSTIVAIDTVGQGRIIERRYDADGWVTGETNLCFRWPA